MIDINDYIRHAPPILTLPPISTTILSQPPLYTTTTATLPVLLHSPITSPLKQNLTNVNKRDYDLMSEESYNHLHTPCSTSTDSTDLIWEMTDSIAQIIIDTLGVMLKKVKIDIWNALLQQQHKNVDGIPDIPLAAINTFLYQVQEDTKPLSQQASADMYCLMTGFMSVYLGLIEIVFNDLVQDNQVKPFDQFLGFFTCKDDVISSSDDYFTWYHWQHRTELVNDLQYRFYTKGIQPFRSLTLMDTVITRFYTTHLLQPVAQQHQKDHGQFYTPQSVVQFMWNRCLPSSSPSSFLILNDHPYPHLTLPRVFDPCMGIGSFLCEYLTRLIDQVKQYYPIEIWHNGEALKRILSQLSDTIWGVEIDPFAFKLGKLNIMIHMFPLYQQCLLLNTSFHGFSIGRLSLFRNDTLRLDKNISLSPTNDSLWEQQQLEKLRDPSQLVFDYIVTNPPYMIRKTGFINDPDMTLYDDTYLGGKGTQAYMYFMWFCLQRCRPTSGQLCFITPSQWTVLQFAESLRKWIWTNCQLLEFFQFEPYKVWPKVQTDSLIFRLCKRPEKDMNNQVIDHHNHHHHHHQHVLFLRYLSRKSSLIDILNAYEHFDPTHAEPSQEDPLIKYKQTPTHDIHLFDTIMHKSFGYLSPTSIVSDQLMDITRSYPRLCDGERGKKGSISPLIWHRGPNTNPVYALVVRTQWAIQQFGKEYCDRWLRPVFYWNGKSSMSKSSLYISPSSSTSTMASSSSTSTSTSISTLSSINTPSTPTTSFTITDDNNNHSHNHNLPPINRTQQHNDINNTMNTNNNNTITTTTTTTTTTNTNTNTTTTIIATNNKNNDNINDNNNTKMNSIYNNNNNNYNNNNINDMNHTDHTHHHSHHSNTLINDKVCKEIKFWYHRDPQRLTKKETSPAEAYVPFDRLDEHHQSFYSMILINKDDSEKLDPTSSLYHYLKEARLELQPGQTEKKIAWCHYNKCGMDVPVKFVHPINFGYFSRTQPRQRFFMDRSYRCVTNQCRTRFFGKHMASIPYAIPTTNQIMEMENYVQQLVMIRHCIYQIIRYVDHFYQQQEQQPKSFTSTRTIMEKVRNCTWDLSFMDYNLLKQISSTSLYLFAMPPPSPLSSSSPLDKNKEDIWIKLKTALECGGRNGNLAIQMIRLLIVQSLLQYAVDHLTFDIYRIPYDLRLSLEQELGLTLTLQWQVYQDHFQKAIISDMVLSILNGSLIID
ncbi:S-adenosyl-L-methionine-dependent methyltransferase [Cunninghamella echinulata]|nr:S-adenosyl-L-methionine-dependent methyltransferase [Cunninghamella echinulata]